MDKSTDTFQTTNPAKRVLTFLTTFRNYRNERLIRDALAKMYNLDVNDTSGLMKVVGDIWDLPLQLKEYLNHKDSTGEHPLHSAVKKVEDLFMNLQLTGSASNFVRIYPPDLITTLEAHTYYMNQDSEELVSEPDEIASSISKIDELISELQSESFDEQFTLYCTDRLEAVRYALVNIDLLGPRKTIEAVDSLFGTAYRETYFKGGNNNKPVREFVSKLIIVGNTILLGLNLVNGAYELGQNSHILPLPVEEGAGESIKLIEDEESTKKTIV